MSEGIRAALAQQQWEVTKGHIRASVSLMSARRTFLGPVANAERDIDRANFERFQATVEAFISEVENEGWAE